MNPEEFEIIGKIDPATGKVGWTKQQTVDDLASQLADMVQVNIKSKGTFGNGSADDTAAIQSALDYLNSIGGGTLLVPSGTYLVGDLYLYSNIEIVFNQNAVFKQKTNNRYIFHGDNLQNIVFDGCNFDGTNNTNFPYPTDGNNTYVPLTCAIVLRGVKNVTIKNCYAKQIALCNISTYEGRIYTDGVTEWINTQAPFRGDGTKVTTLNDNIRIYDNKCDSPLPLTTTYKTPTSDYPAAISVSYTQNYLIRHNNISGYNHGIQFWGGDARQSTDSILCKDGKIHNNKVSMIPWGGIWGSKLQDVHIFDNTISYAHDTGVDFEGCIDCSAVENKIYNCTQSLLSMEINQNIIYQNNKIFLTDDSKFSSYTYVDVFIHSVASSQDSLDNTIVDVIGNEVYNTISKFATINALGLKQLTIKGNTFEDTKIVDHNINYLKMDIIDNVFNYNFNNKSETGSINDIAIKGNFSFSKNIVNINKRNNTNMIYPVSLNVTIAVDNVNVVANNNIVNHNASKSYSKGFMFYNSIGNDIQFHAITFIAMNNTFIGTQDIYWNGIPDTMMIIRANNALASDFNYASMPSFIKNAYATNDFVVANQFYYDSTASKVKYCTMSGWANPSAWAASTAYTKYSIVKNGASSYIAKNDGTSGATAPTGQTDFTDNNIVWHYLGSTATLLDMN